MRKGSLILFKYLMTEMDDLKCLFKKFVSNFMILYEDHSLTD